MIAALVATIAFVPNVFAAGGEITYGKVEDCTADDVLAKEGGKKAEGVISLAKEGSYENVVATYNGWW